MTSIIDRKVPRPPHRLHLLFVLALHLLKPSQGALTFHRFNASLTCADGSPYGIYMEDDPATPISQSQNHILILMGGGSCANPEDCRKDYEERPFVFSTNYNPQRVEGNTVLSSDPTINPSMHSFTKWLIPYCSQDFFLGDINKGKVGGFTHMGSALLREAFSFWSDQVTEARRISSSKAASPLETVVVIGISAGAVGLMNHVQTVRSAVNQVGTANLNLLLDAPSVVSDQEYVGKDFKEAMNVYVDVKDEFPLCAPTHPLSGLYDSVSDLPCCLSTHCLMRRDEKGLASFVVRPDNTTTTEDQSVTLEKLLILDSAYDPVALLGGTTFLQSDVNSEPMFGTDQENAGVASHMIESAGGRKVRAQETAAAVKALALHQQPPHDINLLQKRVQWVMTSCLSHSFLAPAVEFLRLACNHANYGMANYGMVCNQYGHASQYAIADHNLIIRVWRTIKLWNQVRFEGQTIHEIVDDFVTGAPSARSPSDGQTIDLRFEQCSGPNCLSQSESQHLEQPSCQALIEIENTHIPIPVAFQVTWYIFIGLLVIVSFLMKYHRRNPMTLADKEVKSTPEDSCRSLPSLQLKG